MRRQNRTFWNLLHARGESAGTVAKAILSGRAHVTQVLNGARSGSATRRKLIEHGVLTADELAALGWEVPHGAKSHVAQPTATGRKVFNVGMFAVSIVPRGKEFAFEIFDKSRGVVASGKGFTCPLVAESEARKAAIHETLKP